jgi:hypothetical protein
MIAAARQLQAKSPELTVELTLTPSFAASKHASVDAYRERIMRAELYDPAPRVDLTGWRDLATSVRALLRDESALAERQRRTIAWWHEFASPRCGRAAHSRYPCGRRSRRRGAHELLD